MPIEYDRYYILPRPLQNSNIFLGNKLLDLNKNQVDSEACVIKLCKKLTK